MDKGWQIGIRVLLNSKQIDPFICNQKEKEGRQVVTTGTEKT